MKSTKSISFHKFDVCSRRGFTLVEMLVAILIIATMLALTIPAVQAARESARRATCIANLKQLGIAFNAYSTAVGVLPMANNGRHGFSPVSMILPYLDQVTLYNSANFSRMAYSSDNRTVNSTTLSFLLCPSNIGPDQARGWTNYAGNTGFGYQVYKNYTGTFVKGPDICSFASITDGTSTTAMMSEWVRGSGQLSKVYDKQSAVVRTEPLLGASQFDEAIQRCMNFSGGNQDDYYYIKGHSWLQSGLGESLYNHNIPPNGFSCLNGDNIIEGSWTCSSLHARGANVLFVDGHVSFVQESVSLPIWRALGTRANGELIEAGSY